MVEEAQWLTFISAVCQHGSGEAGCLNLLAAQAQRSLRRLNPVAHVLAKHLPSQTHHHFGLQPLSMMP